MSHTQFIENRKKLEKALLALKVMVNKPMEEDRSNIDATIQRFEFTIELFWKTLKYFLAEQGVDARYPKEILRAAYAGNLIEQETVWLSMLNDRNLTSHSYNEELADEIYEHITTTYYQLLEKAVSSLCSFS